MVAYLTVSVPLDTDLSIIGASAAKCLQSLTKALHFSEVQACHH